MKYHIFSLFSLLLITGCGKEQSSTYVVPKQSTPQQPVATMGSQADMEAVAAAHATMSAHAPAGPEFTASLPESWIEVPGTGMRKVSYTIPDTSIDFYLISLSMGDVPSNVNRWRGQVGLPTVSAEEITQEVQTLAIEAHPSSYIEIYNEDGGKGIIAAIIPVDSQYWYFTAKGSVEELKTHAAAIRTFLESMKIN